MPQNRFYIENNLEQDALVQLEGKEHHHLKNVMRAAIGEEVELVNGKGVLATAEIKSIDKNFTELEILTSLEKPSAKKISLAIALTKMPKLELAIEKCTELGAYEFLLFDSVNSEKKGLSNNQRERLEMITISSLKQCGRLYLPKISYFGNLQSLLAHIESKLLVCDFDDKTKPISSFTQLENATILIGPEKGFHNTEKEEYKKHKPEMASIHQNILRAETAAIAATAYLNLI